MCLPLMLEGSEKNLNGLRGAKKVNEFYREGSEFINRRPRAEVGGREHFRHVIEGETKSFSFFRLYYKNHGGGPGLFFGLW